MGALLPQRCNQIAAKGVQWAHLRQVKPEAPQAVLGHAASLQGLVAPPHLPPDPPHWPYLPTNLFVAGFRVGLAGTRNFLQAIRNALVSKWGCIGATSRMAWTCRAVGFSRVAGGRRAQGMLPQPKRASWAAGGSAACHQRHAGCSALSVDADSAEAAGA